MNDKPNLFKNILPYGVLTAVVLMLYSAILFNLKIMSGPMTWVSYLITVGGLAYGLIKYRDGVLKGYISYGQALKTATIMMLIIAGLMAVFMFLYSSFDSTMIQQILDKAEQDMRNKGTMTDEQIEMGLKMTKTFTSPPLMGVFTFIFYMFFGFLMSLIISLIVKKDNPNPFSEIENSTI